MTTKKSMKKDEQAVSPVIAVIMLIAITVVIAAVVAAFAYGIIGGVKKAPNAALVVDGANRGSTTVTIIHHGGDTIVEAFAAGTQLGGDNTGNWSSLEVRINGDVYTNTGATAKPTLNSANFSLTGTATDDFEAGDEIKLQFVSGASHAVPLGSGDSIAIVFTETGDLLQRIIVT